MLQATKKAFLREEGGPRSGGRRLPLSQPCRLTAPLTSGAERVAHFAGTSHPRRQKLEFIKYKSKNFRIFKRLC